MYWLRTRYVEWAKNQNMQLMKDDIKFIEKILNKLPENVHKTIMRDYSVEWLEGMGDGEKVPPKQNLGRCRANNWLRRRLE